VGLLRRRRRSELRPLSEAEAYARCHGARDDDVRIVKVEPRRPRYELGFTGEGLREAFERRLDEREPDAEAEQADEEAGEPAESEAPPG
jgi:hypothetical protein